MSRLSSASGQSLSEESRIPEAQQYIVQFNLTIDHSALDPEGRPVSRQEDRQGNGLSPMTS
jgi:hypothetical protein